jgi:hypothetical protein
VRAITARARRILDQLNPAFFDSALVVQKPNPPGRVIFGPVKGRYQHPTAVGSSHTGFIANRLAGICGPADDQFSEK